MEYKNKLILVILFLCLGMFLNVISSNFIYKNYSNAPIANDCILETIDNVYPWAMIVAEIVIILCVLTFIWLLFKNKEDSIKWIFIIASFYSIRALLMPLTILGTVSSDSFFNNFISMQYGLFPSGHFAIVFLFFLLSYNKSKLWILYLISSIIVAFLLLLGKQHYTIDIIASFFICYAIKVFSERNIFK